LADGTSAGKGFGPVQEPAPAMFTAADEKFKMNIIKFG
jgi:hypothetical protein